MNTPSLVRSLVAVCSASLCLAGCSFLKPSGITPHSFVLSSKSTAPTTPPAGSTNIGIGIRNVKTPGYLAKKSMAMRKDGNEIVYLDTALWAERLDVGLQRVVAANLGALLATDRLYLSTWSPGDVSVEVHLNVEQFDVNSRGEGVLIAWWRVSAPDGEKALASGRFSGIRNGPSPSADALGAAASMSLLADDLAQHLARAIRGNGS